MLSSHIKVMTRGFHQISICFTNICFICTSISNGHVQVFQFEHPHGRTYWSLSEKFGRYEIFVKENSSERRMFYQALLSTYVPITLSDFSSPVGLFQTGPSTSSTNLSRTRFELIQAKHALQNFARFVTLSKEIEMIYFFPLFVESSHYPLSTRLLDVDHS